MAASELDPRARRTLMQLGGAYALAWAATSMVAGPGSAALVALTGDLSHAGLYIALTYTGAAVGAAAGGRAMDRFGRKPPLLVAYLSSAAGFTLAGAGALMELLSLFVCGTLLFAAAFGTINLTRLTAAEIFPPAQRGKGVAWIQMSAMFGAISGPLLLLLSTPLGNMLGRSPLTLVWFLAPPLLLTSALVISRAVEPGTLAHGAPVLRDRAAARSTVVLVPGVAMLVVIGGVTLAASQGAMAAVMGVAGAAVSHAGHSVNVLGGMMFMHFVGMFGLSRVVGKFADRAGRRTTMLIGAALLIAGGITVSTIPGAVAFGAGLFLVGLGWSFGFIGATVLLADVTPVHYRARTMGRMDLGAQLTSAAIAIGGGWWFAHHGVAGLGLVAVIVAAVPATLLLFVLREPRPGIYGDEDAQVAAPG